MTFDIGDIVVRDPDAAKATYGIVVQFDCDEIIVWWLGLDYKTYERVYNKLDKMIDTDDNTRSCKK